MFLINYKIELKMQFISFFFKGTIDFCIITMYTLIIECFEIYCAYILLSKSVFKYTEQFYWNIVCLKLT